MDIGVLLPFQARDSIIYSSVDPGGRIPADPGRFYVQQADLVGAKDFLEAHPVCVGDGRHDWALIQKDIQPPGHRSRKDGIPGQGPNDKQRAGGGYPPLRRG
jgi:hypothetical protein